MKRTKLIAVLCLVAMITMLMTACASYTAGRAKPQALALLIRRSANVCEPNFDGKQIQETVRSVMDSEGYLTVISIDSTPTVVASGSLEIDQQYRNGDPTLLEREAKQRADALFAELGEIRADNPEADTLEALRLAVRDLSNAPSGAQKTIFLIDSGLSTAGLLSFDDALLRSEPEEIVTELQKHEAVPDLSEMTVIWQQLGDVAYPQQTLTPLQRNRLIRIWRAVVEAGGGEFHLSESLSGPAIDAADFPAVSPVELRGESMTVPSGKQETEFTSPVTFGEDMIRFLGDLAEYADPEQATAVISPVADYMLSHSELTLLLVGCTAGDTNSEFARKLSSDRAEAVKATLVSFGVHEERILTIGLGSEDPWHVYGLDTSDPRSTVNRKVVMLDASTDLAKSLIQLP